MENKDDKENKDNGDSKDTRDSKDNGDNKNRETGDLSQEEIKNKVLARFPQLQQLETLKKEERIHFFREIAHTIEDELNHI